MGSGHHEYSVVESHNYIIGVNVVFKNTYAVITIFFSTLAFGQDQSPNFLKNSWRCAERLNRLINSTQADKKTVNSLERDLTTEFSFESGTKVLCDDKRKPESKKAAKLRRDFYSKNGIEFDRFEKIYTQGLQRLMALEKAKIHNEISQAQICHEISTNAFIQSSIELYPEMDMAAITCDDLQSVGFDCGRYIPKNDYKEFLAELELIAKNLNTQKEALWSDVDKLNYKKLMRFVGAARPAIQTRISDLLPERSDYLNVKYNTTQNIDTVRIQIEYMKDSSFPSDKNWDEFSKNYEQAIETFWKGSYQDQNKHLYAFEVIMEEAKLQTDLSRAWTIGKHRGVGLGVTNRNRKYIGFRSDIIDSGFQVWLHEFGHVLGFGEAYGTWIEADENNCRIGGFNDMTNVMNNKTLDGNITPKLNPAQIKGIIETYANSPHYQMDREIYELIHSIEAYYLSILTQNGYSNPFGY